MASPFALGSTFCQFGGGDNLPGETATDSNATVTFVYAVNREGKIVYILSDEDKLICVSRDT